MRLILLALIATTCGSALADFVILRPHKISRIIVGRGEPTYIQLEVPSRHQVAGFENLEFLFRPEATGSVTTPATKVEVAGTAYLIEEIEWLVFDEKPEHLTIVINDWPHDEHDTFHVVQIDIAGATEETMPTLGLIQDKLVNVPDGFEASESGGNGGKGVTTQVFSFWNPTGKAVTLTRDNFKDCNLPEEFPELVIPPTKPKKVK